MYTCINGLWLQAVILYYNYFDKFFSFFLFSKMKMKKKKQNKNLFKDYAFFNLLSYMNSDYRLQPTTL